jgi:mRNA interferase MazF
MSQNIAATPQAAPMPNPKRGEVWNADLEPVEGSEQGKTRPVIVLSQPPTGRETVRLCAPIMHAKRVHGGLFWCIALAPSAANGLHKQSTADAAQTRALDVVRFQEKLGEVTPDETDLIADALSQCVKR